MFKTMRLVVSLILIAAMMMGATCVFAEEKPIGNLEGYQYYPEGMTEEQAGILTDEASNEIKRKIQEKGLKNIEPLLDRYFNSMTTSGYYDDSVDTVRGKVSPFGSATPAVAVGTTKYTKSYENSGIFTYRTKSGVYSSIANATISMFLGKVEKVGNILSWVYSAFSGAGPDKQKQAKVKTMYSYRYTEEKGWVYYLDYKYDYYPRVTVVSRDTCEHYWGQYVDTNGFARQKTRDFGVKKTEKAPHKGNSTWIKNKAKSLWKADLPHYYEDWND